MRPIGTSPRQATAEATRRRQQKAAIVMTVVFLIINLSVILSYEWGPTPQFRPDAPLIILFGILVAAIVHIAARYAGQARLRSRLCTVCGRSIPFDALFCPYCGHRFPPP